MESHSIISPKFKSRQKLKHTLKVCDPKILSLWHDRLGHPGTNMIRKIIDNSIRHSSENQQLTIPGGYLCTPCSLGKFISRPSFLKVESESPLFLQRIHGDICGPINPPSGPFRYFMVLIDASTRWSNISLLSTQNVVFSRLLAQLINLRAQFPD